MASLVCPHRRTPLGILPTTSRWLLTSFHSRYFALQGNISILWQEMHIAILKCAANIHVNIGHEKEI